MYKFFLLFIFMYSILNANSGENNSTDHFAIIPTKYIFNFPKIIRAGENYKIEINATNDNDKNQSYNQNLGNIKDKNVSIFFIHKSGEKEYNSSIDLNFSNGISNRNDFNISDVGIYSIEINDTNYASIDQDDTDEINRTIYGKKIIKIIPYKYKLNLIENNTSNNKNWLYQSQDNNYSLKVFITAENKQNQQLKNFDKDEYSSEVNVSLKLLLNKIDSKDINLSYIKLENQDIQKKDFQITNSFKEINYTINENNFSNGKSTNLGIITYIKKNITNPNSPIDLNIIEINTTSKLSNNLGIKLEKNITYFYSKLYTEDLYTNNEFNNTNIKILIYDNNKTDILKRFSNINEILINWYSNIKDNITNLKNKIMKINYIMNSKNIDINITNKQVTNGNILINIDNNLTPNVNYGVIHLDFPKYLWYSKYNQKYDFSNDSNCINHYCIEYIYKNDLLKKEVGSGNFQGSKIKINYNLKTSKKGIKFYR